MLATRRFISSKSTSLSWGGEFASSVEIFGFEDSIDASYVARFKLYASRQGDSVNPQLLGDPGNVGDGVPGCVPVGCCEGGLVEIVPEIGESGIVGEHGAFDGTVVTVLVTVSRPMADVTVTVPPPPPPPVVTVTVCVPQISVVAVCTTTLVRVIVLVSYDSCVTVV
jgi:hypothetical protein